MVPSYIRPMLQSPRAPQRPTKSFGIITWSQNLLVYCQNSETPTNRDGHWVITGLRSRGFRCPGSLDSSKQSSKHNLSDYICHKKKIQMDLKTVSWICWPQAGLEILRPPWSHLVWIQQVHPFGKKPWKLILELSFKKPRQLLLN